MKTAPLKMTAEENNKMAKFKWKNLTEVVLD